MAPPVIKEVQKKEDEVSLLQDIQIVDPIEAEKNAV